MNETNEISKTILGNCACNRKIVQIFKIDKRTKAGKRFKEMFESLNERVIHLDLPPLIIESINNLKHLQK